MVRAHVHASKCRSDTGRPRTTRWAEMPSPWRACRHVSPAMSAPGSQLPRARDPIVLVVAESDNTLRARRGRRFVQVTQFMLLPRGRRGLRLPEGRRFLGGIEAETGPVARFAVHGPADRPHNQICPLGDPCYAAHIAGPSLRARRRLRDCGALPRPFGGDPALRALPLAIWSAPHGP